MKNRTRLALAGLAAATMLISACGSDPTPTPTAAPQASSPVAGGSADATADSSPDQAPTSEPVDPTSSDASEPPSTEESTSGTTDDSTTGSTPAMDLDDTTTAFFATMCGGLSGVLDTTIDDFDPDAPAEEQRQTAVDNYSKLGAAMGATAGELQQIPPPTFDRGDEVAAAVVSAFTKGSAAATQAAADIAAAPADGLEQAFDTADDAFDAAGDEFDSVEDVLSQPGLEAALAQIPECEPLFG